jgi:predicted DNA-binding transcriptional regulator AlpA
VTLGNDQIKARTFRGSQVQILSARPDVPKLRGFRDFLVEKSSTDDWGLEPLMDVHELAAYPGIPISPVYDWRVHGIGPRAYRFGKHLKFAISDVRAWIAQQREPSSSSPRRTDRR